MIQTTINKNWIDPYKIDRSINQSQLDYISLLEDIFKVYNLKERKLMKYNTIKWQKDFHAYSVNCLHPDKWKDRLVRKGRGISFSVSSMIDLIMSANKFSDMTFPVVSHRQVAGWDLIKVGQRLIDNANYDFKVDKPFGKWTNGSIKFENGSDIKFFPSGNPDSLRQVRTFSVLYDEVNFYRDIKSVIDAGEDCINQGGQSTYGSTIYDRNSYFWEMCEREEKLKQKYLFTLPTFNKSQFDINKNIIEQVNNGLQPLAWWINLQKLEDKRNRDSVALLRENQCTPSDEGSNFLKIQHILKNIPTGRNALVNYSRPFKTDNMLKAGLDIATEHDLASMSIFEETEFGEIQRHLKYWKGIELQDLQKIAEQYMLDWNLGRFRIDMTGMGTQLSQSMRREFGSPIEPIHFAKKINTVVKGVKEGIRDKMAYNMRDYFVDGKIKLIDDSIQIKHLNGWSYDLKKYSGTDGHGDIFWSNAMALLPVNYKIVNKGPLNISSTIRNTKKVEISNIERKDIQW